MMLKINKILQIYKSYILIESSNKFSFGDVLKKKNIATIFNFWTVVYILFNT